MILDHAYDYNRESIQSVVAWKITGTQRDSDGNLYVRYLNWNDGRWNWDYNWLDNDWNASYPAVVRATNFISSPDFWGSFLSNKR